MMNFYMAVGMVGKIESGGRKPNHYDVAVAIGPMIAGKVRHLLTKKLGIPTIILYEPDIVDGTACAAPANFI